MLLEELAVPLVLRLVLTRLLQQLSALPVLQDQFQLSPCWDLLEGLLHHNQVLGFWIQAPLSI